MPPAPDGCKSPRPCRCDVRSRPSRSPSPARPAARPSRDTRNGRCTLCVSQELSSEPVPRLLGFRALVRVLDRMERPARFHRCKMELRLAPRGLNGPGGILLLPECPTLCRGGQLRRYQMHDVEEVTWSATLHQGVHLSADIIAKSF